MGTNSNNPLVGVGALAALAWLVLELNATDFIPIEIRAVAVIAATGYLLLLGLRRIWRWRSDHPGTLPNLGFALVCVAALGVAGVTVRHVLSVVEDAKSDKTAPLPQQVPKLDPNEVSPMISVEGVDGDDLEGKILIRNASGRAVTLLASSYNAFGGHIQSSGEPHTIPAYQTFPITLEAGNKLVKNGRLTLRYDFKFLGDEATHKGAAAFTVSEHPKAGSQIGPDDCCDAKDAPLLSGDPVSMAEDKLREPEGHFGIPFHDANGVVKLGTAPFQVIYFDPSERVVLFLSGPVGKQIVRQSGMRRNPYGEHWVEVDWSVKANRFEMAVDGIPARHISLSDLKDKQ